MINFVICDDEASARADFSHFVKKYSQERALDYSVKAYSSGKSLLSDYPFGTDLLLLDICMGSDNGIDVASRIREIDPKLCIVFITSMPQYALKSYSVKPFGFLTKPLSYKSFCTEMDLAVKHVSGNAGHSILVKDAEGSQRKINVKDICYIEVMNHYVTLNMDGEKIKMKSTISSMEKELLEYGFFRCHQAFLVNYRYISAIGDQITLRNGEQIPISRPRKKDFMTELTAYLGRHNGD